MKTIRKVNVSNFLHPPQQLRIAAPLKYFVIAPHMATLMLHSSHHSGDLGFRILIL